MKDHDPKQKAIVETLPKTKLLHAVRNLFELQTEALLSAPSGLRVVVAGGIAAHYWTRHRATSDVDCEFLFRTLPIETSCQFTDEKGIRREVYFDRNYNPMFGPMHDEYLSRVVEVPDLTCSPRLVVSVLAPVDLAISKLARFGEHDQEDIASMSRLGLISHDELQELATEALDYFVGSKDQVLHHLQLAIDLVKAQASLVEVGQRVDDSFNIP